MNTASDLSSKEYENKSLWKQDEKYIKNVMQVYQKNEDKIKKTSGTPYWDYASTLESFDERFVMVPIVESGRVVSVMQVPRHGSKIRFYYTNFKNQIDFFQALIFAKYKKIIPSDTSETDKTIVCKTESVSVWLPDNESNPDPGSGAGHWGVHSVVKCKQVLDNCSGVVGPNGECITGGSGGDPGEFPYPGGGGNSDKTPCEKVKTIGKSTRAKEIFKELKGKTTGTTAEHAYTFSDDGGIINENHIVGIPGSKEVNLPISSPIDAYIHSHYQGLLSIFSVSDIFALASIYKMAKLKTLTLL
ncbi:hypothetical protein M2347_000191 [Chryseobacterium sp. H1D6B]|uniref:hypothetical protein n=1 Tax=Chryseobacterium sp. H1D6B TaxID=2940588 RepID=UPI0015C78383|nr:hypothetical protein [Chryseobacterium sp. H1D6B]MDH6250464.1 hypothetical protein [Chryseobacterium sp. H1D6B]